MNHDACASRGRSGVPGAGPERGPDAFDLTHLRALVRDVPDFPKPGIVFKDITPVLADRVGFRFAVERLAEAGAGLEPELVVGVEARGFLFAAAVAYRLGLGLVPVRKPGKLPWRAVREAYALEYGSDALEMHQDALGSGARVLVVDDVLATGGTAAAVARLIERLGGRVAGFAFLLELEPLAGRTPLAGRPVRSVLSF